MALVIMLMNLLARSFCICLWSIARSDMGVLVFVALVLALLVWVVGTVSVLVWVVFLEGLLVFVLTELRELLVIKGIFGLLGVQFVGKFGKLIFILSHQNIGGNAAHKFGSIICGCGHGLDMVSAKQGEARSVGS